MMMAGQTINDRLLAARHSIAGQGLAKSVCKATTEEMIAPKKKHLDYLVHCTNEPNVSIPHLANLLVERTQNTNWVVVHKSLITVHHLLAYGNERFTQYLASSNSTFQLSNFLDKSGAQGYDMSPFIRRYAKYLNEKSLSYRTVAFDFCKVKRGKEEGSLRMMNAERLLKTLPVLQAQLDALLEFDCTPNDLTNSVINMCFMLLFRDLIRLFACYNDGIINLLEKYFDMNKKNARDALDLYKKFLIRMDRVAEFLKVAENVGIDKGDIPDLTRAPSSLLDALETHLAALDPRRSAASTPTAPTASAQKSVASVMGALSTTGSAFSAAASAPEPAGLLIDDAARHQALMEEEAAINQYKVQMLQGGDWTEDVDSYLNKVQSPTSLANNPFLAQPTSNNNQSIVDLFGPAAPAPASNAAPAHETKASDDLLSLGNPFADMFGGAAPAPAAPASNQWPPSNGFGFSPQQPINADFGVFGNNDAAAANPFMGMGEPSASPARPPPPKSAFDELEEAMRMSLGGSPARQPQPMAAQGGMAAQSGMFGSPAKAQPMNAMGQQQQQQDPGKVLTGDLDSSLAQLANNLTMKGNAPKPMQWSSPKNGKGGAWSPQPMQATTGAGYRPMSGLRTSRATGRTGPTSRSTSRATVRPTGRALLAPQGSGSSLPPAPLTLHTYHPPHYVLQQPAMVMGMQQPLGMPMAAQMRPPIPPQPTHNQFS